MSFHENTEMYVKAACMFEKYQAEKEWGKTYNSLHEGWAVLKEEVEEVQIEIKDLESDFRDLWFCIRNNNIDSFDTNIGLIQESAIRAMKELAQVWAVCEKMRATLKEQE